MQQPVLKQYIRDKKNNPIGILLATQEDNGIHIGWSLCSKKDKFNKEKGMTIALGRMNVYYIDNDMDYMLTVIPNTIKKDFQYIYDRADRYFNKTAKTE
jgi:hypothetical protein